MAVELSQVFRICSFPVAVCPGPYVNVAFSVHRLIISSMSFLDIDSWKVFSIWLIS